MKTATKNTMAFKVALLGSLVASIASIACVISLIFVDGNHKLSVQNDVYSSGKVIEMGVLDNVSFRDGNGAKHYVVSFNHEGYTDETGAKRGFSENSAGVNADKKNLTEETVTAEILINEVASSIWLKQLFTLLVAAAFSSQLFFWLSFKKRKDKLRQASTES